MKRYDTAVNARRILVLGFGITGRAICEFARCRSLHVAVSECGPLSAEQQAWLQSNAIPFEQAGHTTRLLQDSDMVVLSPGISNQHPVVQEARRLDVPVRSEIEYALSFVPHCPVIAVTGTNGKSSTVEVIGVLLRSLGKRAWVAGNIGIPLISLIDEIEEQDVLVLEMSSYQLEQSSSLRPEAGVLLNLEPDHIRRHGDMPSYARAKANLFLHQRPSDAAIMPRALAPRFEGGLGRRVFYDEEFDTLPSSAKSLLPHEQQNLRAALAACRVLRPDIDVATLPMTRVVETFRLPHRMETIGFVNGVRVINDSKSTNAASAIAALRSMDAPVVLLLGGRSKGAGYEALAEEMARADIRGLILFGEAAPELAGLFDRDVGLMVEPLVTPSLDEGVIEALRVMQPGDVLLLSPACSSFDAFADYAERGEHFSALIRSLEGFQAAPART